jgi:hypothetical protein
MKIIILKIKKLATKAREMHIKINTHQNDSNFLTHALWSKPNLGIKQIHLELL